MQIDLEAIILSSKILIVDDKPSNIALLEIMLSQAGYDNVHSTTDSRTVTTLYQEQQHDLILLDLRMPYLDGFQVMQRLSETQCGGYLPILVLTAQNDTQTRQKALQSGAKDFITKPFDSLETLQRIRNMLEVKALYNQRMAQNDQLEDMVNARTQQLRQTRLEIIRCLGRAGEFRDNETGAHIIRMSKYSQLLARACGQTEAFAEMVLNASPMHDVGKIGIPDHILLKPDRLNPEEWRIMQTHATIGAEILGEHPSDIMQMARTIALTHHEKWGGCGYPNQLKGEQIPIEGRISSICDVFDALCSTRPYKKPWPLEKTLDFIKDGAGSHFDPALVPFFFGIIDEVLDIQSQYLD